MSIVSTQTIKTTDLYNKVNEGTWRIIAILGITSIGSVLVVAFKDNSQLIVIVSDLASTGSSSILDGSGAGTLATVDATSNSLRVGVYQPSTANFAAVINSIPSGTAFGLVVRVAGSATLTANPNPSGGIVSGQTAMNNATATQIGSQTGTQWNMLVKNLDGANPVDIGGSGVTFGTGYRLGVTAPDNAAQFRLLKGTNLFGISGAGNPVVSWIQTL